VKKKRTPIVEDADDSAVELILMGDIIVGLSVDV